LGSRQRSVYTHRRVSGVAPGGKSYRARGYVELSSVLARGSCYRLRGRGGVGGGRVVAARQRLRNRAAGPAIDVAALAGRHATQCILHYYPRCQYKSHPHLMKVGRSRDRLVSWLGCRLCGLGVASVMVGSWGRLWICSCSRAYLLHSIYCCECCPRRPLFARRSRYHGGTTGASIPTRSPASTDSFRKSLWRWCGVGTSCPSSTTGRHIYRRRFCLDSTSRTCTPRRI
jgi:hypothetical protein